MTAIDRSVSTIILNWQQWRDTIACLESLVAVAHAHHRIIICDNDSKDGSVDRINDWAQQRLPSLNAERAVNGDPSFHFCAPQRFAECLDPCTHLANPARYSHEIVLLSTGSNHGYAAGNNFGIRYALANDKCDFIWIVNNDTVVKPDALDHLLRRMGEDQSIGMCGSTLCYMHEPEFVQLRAGVTFSAWTGRSFPICEGEKVSAAFDTRAIEKQLRYVYGASMLVRRDFIEVIGLMNEDYFIYYEELDWAERGRPRYRLGYAPDSVVYHKIGGTIGSKPSGEPSDLSTYYLYRNRVRFCLRFSKLSLPFVIVDYLKDLLISLLRGNAAKAGLIFRAAVGLKR
jgi:GT2 family glycosyltransferase